MNVDIAPVSLTVITDLAAVQRRQRTFEILDEINKTHGLQALITRTLRQYLAEHSPPPTPPDSLIVTSGERIKLIVFFDPDKQLCLLSAADYVRRLKRAGLLPTPPLTPAAALAASIRQEAAAARKAAVAAPRALPPARPVPPRYEGASTLELWGYDLEPAHRRVRMTNDALLECNEWISRRVRELLEDEYNLQAKSELLQCLLARGPRLPSAFHLYMRAELDALSRYDDDDLECPALARAALQRLARLSIGLSNTTQLPRALLERLRYDLNTLHTEHIQCGASTPQQRLVTEAQATPSPRRIQSTQSLPAAPINTYYQPPRRWPAGYRPVAQSLPAVRLPPLAQSLGERSRARGRQYLAKAGQLLAGRSLDLTSMYRTYLHLVSGFRASLWAVCLTQLLYKRASEVPLAQSVLLTYLAGRMSYKAVFLSVSLLHWICFVLVDSLQNVPIPTPEYGNLPIPNMLRAWLEPLLIVTHPTPYVAAIIDYSSIGLLVLGFLAIQHVAWRIRRLEHTYCS